MMTILIKEYTKQTAQLDLQLNSLEVQLAQFKGHALYLKLQTQLKEHLATYNKNILHNKETKFWRDKTSFSEGKAYKWLSNKPQSRGRARDCPEPHMLAPIYNLTPP